VAVFVFCSLLLQRDQTRISPLLTTVMMELPMTRKKSLKRQRPRHENARVNSGVRSSTPSAVVASLLWMIMAGPVAMVSGFALSPVPPFPTDHRQMDQSQRSTRTRPLSSLLRMTPSAAEDSEEWLLSNQNQNQNAKEINSSTSTTNGATPPKKKSDKVDPRETKSILIIEEEEDEEDDYLTSSLSEFDSPPPLQQQQQQQTKRRGRKRLDLMWCNSEYCKDTIRERVDSGGHIVLTGPATGQVAYEWKEPRPSTILNGGGPQTKHTPNKASVTSTPRDMALVLLLIKPNDEELLQIAADAVREWVAPHNATGCEPIQVLLDPSVAARLEHYHQIPSQHLQLFEDAQSSPFPDLICALGGDGLLMHAGMLFQGPSPPILSIAGGSLGFLTPFQTTEMVQAVRIALGLVDGSKAGATSSNTLLSSSSSDNNNMTPDDSVYPPNMASYPYEPLRNTAFAAGRAQLSSTATTAVPHDPRMCLSIRMRLSCRILNRQGVCRAQYNVLNEVVIDRGSSPYLAALECFCDNHHMTTVQADGVIFATPTGSTAYSMAAGGSVVHPAVPCILVTPICPHVLSFRSMIFPDHVVLQCVVPDDARSEASVAFDGKHRQPLHRGDCITIQLSKYPVPTLNRLDHSDDWLHSLKQQFGFNARPRQRPLNGQSANFGTSSSHGSSPSSANQKKNPPDVGNLYDDHSW